MAYEIWDGKASIVFVTAGEQLAAVTLDDGSFHISIADNDFQITDESILDVVFEALNKTAAVNHRRPIEQLNVNLNEYPSGIRCDMCLLHISSE